MKEFKNLNNDTRTVKTATTDELFKALETFSKLGGNGIAREIEFQVIQEIARRIPYACQQPGFNYKASVRAAHASNQEYIGDHLNKYGFMGGIA